VGSISRSTFSLDLAAKRPMVGTINAMYKQKSGKDLNDLTSREVIGLLVLADAIDRAKSTDGTKIRDALAATIFRGNGPSCPGSGSSSTRWARTTTPTRCCCNMSVANSSPSFPQQPRLPRRLAE